MRRQCSAPAGQTVRTAIVSQETDPGIDPVPVPIPPLEPDPLDEPADPLELPLEDLPDPERGEPVPA